MQQLAQVGLFVLSTSVALAAPKTVVLATGDCKDPALNNHLHALSSAMAKQPGRTLLGNDAAMEQLRPTSQRSAEDLARVLDAAQMQFYSADFAKAETAVSGGLLDVVRLPPSAKRQDLWVKAQLLLALLYRDTQRMDAGDESFRRVLRVAPNYQLDPDYYSPNTRMRFEKMRKELSATKKVRLVLRSSPPGAEVFLDGAFMGKTPLTQDVVPASYQLEVGKDGQSSFPRSLDVSTPTQMHVDLSFEGAVSAKGSCLSDTGDEQSRLSKAVKLATMLDADEVVLLWTDKPATGPTWLSASLVSVANAQKIREGGLKLQGSGEDPSAMEALARFVATGYRSERVQTPLAPKAMPVPTAKAEPFADNSDSVRNSKRRLSMPLLLSGAGVAVAGGALSLAALLSWQDYDHYRTQVGSSPDERAVDPAYRTQARAALDRYNFEKPAGFALLGVGAAVAAVGSYLLLQTPKPAAVSVGPLWAPGGGGFAIAWVPESPIP